LEGIASNDRITAGRIVQTNSILWASLRTRLENLFRIMNTILTIILIVLLFYFYYYNYFRNNLIILKINTIVIKIKSRNVNSIVMAVVTLSCN